LCLSAAAFAQNALPVLPAGDAAVAGFSGTVIVGSPPEARRLDKTIINLDGPALRVIGLDRLGAPAQGQLIAAKKAFTATARQIGQVFSVALDDASPPNVYAAATSAYGLPIVVPDADGDGLPDRARTGAPNAAYMPGLFGPPAAAGGPGSIWKINGSTGAITLFANVVLSGVPNSGPALGGLVFDPASRQLLVADRDTGMIHRFTLDGVDRGIFDHGAQALPASGLPPVPFDPRKRINLQNPAFDSTNPATWAYAPPARRVFGLAVNQGRLYYAIAAGLRIWSVSLLPDGSFGSDARLELTVPPGAQPGSEISEILFDNSGDMLVAERGAPTGAYDYEALAEPGDSRVLRFRPMEADDPPSEDFWFPVPKDYAVGFPPNFRNDNGGIAIGYGYDAVGNINRAVCAGALWTSGERLRMTPDPAIARLLQPGGPLAVHGLQGNAAAMVQPLNVPPFNSYFVDYYDIGERPAWSGHLGGVAIWRVCPHTQVEPVLWETLIDVAIECPAGYGNVRGQCVPASCPPEQMTPDGKCGQPICKPVYRPHAVGIPCCPEGQVANNGRCTKPNGPDLSIDKKIISCTDKGVCKFRITVTNNGPGDYTGPIVVGEDLSPGNVNMHPVSPAGNWSCGSIPTSSLPANLQSLAPPGGNLHACILPNATLHPGDTAVIDVNGKVTPTLRGQPKNCTAVLGFPLNEPNYANNAMCVDIPPPKPKYTVEKIAPKSCFYYPAGTAGAALLGGNTYVCKFTIVVTNTGSVPLSGAVFTDTPTAPGRIVNIEETPTSPPQSWQCTDPSNVVSTTCTRAPGHDIQPGQNATVVIDVAVLASNVTTGMVENCALPGAAPGNLVRPGNLGNLGQQLPDALQRLSNPGQSSANAVQSGLGIGGSAGGVLSGHLPQPCAQVQVQTPVSACPDGSARNSDGNCPTPTTTSCPFPTFPMNGTCCTREAIAAGTCGTIVTRCPEGMQRGLNGQCLSVDPRCQGPNCPQPVLPTCIGSDCPTPTTTTKCGIAEVFVNGACCNVRDYRAGNCSGTSDLCANGKAKVDGKCPQLCPDGSVPREHSHIPCPTNTEEKKKPRHTTPRRPRPKTDTDKPEKSSPSLPLQIQIGPGFPGGRPGSKPSGPTKGSSGCGLRCG
jgi:hypothetical protein